MKTPITSHRVPPSVRWRAIAAGAAAVAVLSSSSSSAQTFEVVSYYRITPGVTTRAEAELILGEPAARETDTRFSYRPDPQDLASSSVVINYFSDSQRVSVIRAVLKTPAAADAMRQALGSRILTIQSQTEPIEVYSPRLMGLVLAAPNQTDTVKAVLYYSARQLSTTFANRAAAAHDANRTEDARVEAEKGRTIDPQNAGPHLQLGRVLRAASDFAAAEREFQLAAAAPYTAASRAMAHSWLGVLYAGPLKAAGRAEEEYRKAVNITLPPAEESRRRYDYGLFLRNQGRLVDAVRELERAAQLDPEFVLAQQVTSALLFDQGELKRALPFLANLTEILDRRPSTPKAERVTAHFRHGEALCANGQFTAAQTEYRIILDITGPDLATLRAMGICAVRARDFDAAASHFERAVAMSPSDVASHARLVETLLEAGRPADALAKGESALAIVKDQPDVLYQMARVTAALNKKKDALNFLKRAVATGFRDAARLAGDARLSSLHGEGDFRKISALIDPRPQ